MRRSLPSPGGPGGLWLRCTSSCALQGRYEDLSISVLPARLGAAVASGRNPDRGVGTMSHPVIHAEIRSADPDATRAFFAELFGWTYSDGAFPGYSFVDTGVEGAIPTAIGPLQGGADSVLFFVGVQDVEATLKRAEELGGKTIQ